MGKLQNARVLSDDNKRIRAISGSVFSLFFSS